MRQIITTALCILSLALFGQSPIAVNVMPEVTLNNSNTYAVSIPQANLKDIKKDWLKYVCDGSKGKSSEVNGEYLQSGAVNKNISPYPFDIYSKLLETTEGVTLSVRLTQNNKAINSTANQDLAVKKYMHDFAVEHYREAVKEELKTEQDKLNVMEKDLQKLIKEEERSVKTINENQRETKQDIDDVATNNADIKNSNEKINDQKDMVAITAADPNATKGAKKTLSELEDEKKDLQKDNAAYDKDIDSRSKENREEKRNISTAQQNQELNMAAIEVQKQKVRDIQNKLNSIN